jgi:predicted nucleic acid-binding protein
MIIDASVAFKWLIEEQDSDRALEWIGRTALVAPTLIHIEVANALWKRFRRGELGSDEGASEHLAGLLQLIETVDETGNVPRAFELAGELDHPIYDCIYLALAEARDDQVVTADLRFVRSVRGSAHEGRVLAL